jgi:hypothetical protein
MDINEQTRVPLFAVLAAIPIIIGFIFWMSSLYASVSQAEITNNKQDVKIDQLYELLIDIRDRVIRIEEKISK